MFEHYYNIIKGRLYANHLSGVKASLYDTEQTQGRVYAPRSRPFLAGLSMRQVAILLSGVKASLYVNEHKGEFMCREHASVIALINAPKIERLRMLSSTHNNAQHKSRISFAHAQLR